jgi:signal transduction histidine kinase
MRDPGSILIHSRRIRGLGIISMRERARLAGGSVVLANAEGGGTEVIARLPLAGANASLHTTSSATRATITKSQTPEVFP